MIEIMIEIVTISVAFSIAKIFGVEYGLIEIVTKIVTFNKILHGTINETVHRTKLIVNT